MKPLWLTIAEEKIGQHEVRGGENPFIIECHATTTLKAKEDEVAWCASFVNWCLMKADYKRTNSAAAISFLNCGTPVEEPEEGDIIVIQKKKVKGVDKKTGSSSGNHVGFFRKIKDGRVFILGGNQSDSVKDSSFGLASYNVLGYRRPIKEEA